MAGLDYCSCGVCGKRLFYDGDMPARTYMRDAATTAYIVCSHCNKKKLKQIEKLKKHLKRGK